jgi:hypothetical protein
LKEFYDAADLGCNGVLPATAAEVYEIVEVANKKFQWPSHTIRFSEKIGACLQSVEHFSGVIDDVQANPTISALVWGCLKFLLIVS